MPSALDAPIYSLNGMNDLEQSRRDLLHKRLLSRSTTDLETGCWIFTGPWTEQGHGKMRVGHRVYKIGRVSMWVYLGFELWDTRVVYHTCPNPACFNFEHLAIANTHAEALAAMRKLKIFSLADGRSGRRFSREQAEEIRRRIAAGENVTAMKYEFGVKQQSSLIRIGDGRRWAPQKVSGKHSS